MKILALVIASVFAAAALAAPAVHQSPAPSPSPRSVDESDETTALSAPLFATLEQRLARAFTPLSKGAFAPVSARERKGFGDAFRLLLDEAESRHPGAPTAPLRAAFDGLGFRVETITLFPGDTVFAVLEAPQRLRASGVFLVRSGPTLPVVLMAPHPRSDRGTDLLGQRLFGLTRARAYIQATMHRKAPAPDGTPSDPAHRTDTFFQVATEVLEARGEHLFVQLHGFELKRHGTVDPRTGVILSDGLGTPKMGSPFARVALALRDRHKPGFVALWGLDTKELGGTTNAQARYINPRGKSTFVHVEMSAAVRAEAVRETGGRLPPRGSFFGSLMAIIGAK